MPKPPAYRRYIVSILAPAVALALTLAIMPLAETATLLLFLVAVMVTTWYGGRGPGAVAIVLGAGFIAYFILPPVYEFYIAGSTDLLRFAVYLGSSGMVAWLAASR